MLGEKVVSLTVVEKLTIYIQKNKSDSYLLPYTKSYYHGLKDLHIKPETLKLLEKTD